MESILILLVSVTTRSVTKEGFVVRGVHSYSTRSVTKEGFVVPGVHSYSTRSVTKEGFVVLKGLLYLESILILLVQ